MLSKILNIIYPNRCVLCQKYIDIFNPNCKQFTCQNCRLKLEYCMYKIHTQSMKNKSFDYLIYTFKYTSFIRNLLLNFKFNNKKFICYFFANELSTTIRSSIKLSSIDAITYVPVSFKRYLERGFNQSYLIANQISKELKIPIIKHAILKLKNNKRQSELQHSERAQNAKDVYSFNQIYNIQNKTILLIDDIYTTGSTAFECSKILKMVGANKVIVAVIAKA